MKRTALRLALLSLLTICASCGSDPMMRGDKATSLDALFQRLQTTQDDDEAHLIEVSIRHVWAQSGRQAIDALMTQAADAVHAGHTEDALAALDQVVAAAPDYAEGWNLRATVHYLRDEYGLAVADIERVLALEPRHFGALAGLGRILLELEDKKSALRAFDAALAVNPHLTDIRHQRNELREELAGIPI